MKKWTTALLGVILTVSITACGNDKETENSANAAAATTAPEATEAASSTPAPTEAAANLPTLEELMAKTAEASKDLNSFEMDADVLQNIDVKQGENTQQQEVEMSMHSKYTKNPMVMYQEVKMDMPGQGETTVEQYIMEDGVYMLTNGQWSKLPSELNAQYIESMKQSSSPEKQLEQFKSIAKDTVITEKDDEYVLTAELSGSNVKELAKSYLRQSGNSEEQVTQMMQSMDVKNMSLTYYIDKKTYLPTGTDVDMVMDMNADDGMSMTINMNMDSIISSHNEIEKIELPAEAKNAKTAAPAAQ